MLALDGGLMIVLGGAFWIQARVLHIRHVSAYSGVEETDFYIRWRVAVAPAKNNGRWLYIYWSCDHFNLLSSQFKIYCSKITFSSAALLSVNVWG